MKTSAIVLGLCLSAFSLFGQQKNFTLEDIWNSAKFVPKTVSGIYSSKSGDQYTTLTNTEKNTFIARFSYKTGDLVDTLFSLSSSKDPLKKGIQKISSYTFDESETKILLKTNDEPIYRRSSKADFFIYDLTTHQLSIVSPNGKQQNATLSPDGKKICFMRDNNLYLVDIDTKKETQITSDGKLNEIINGHADWVYEEEFELINAFVWAPDSKTIAFYKFNEKEVKEFSIPMYSTLYPTEYTYKYPKAGEKNSEVSIHLFDIATGNTRRVKTEEAKDVYFPSINWINSSSLMVMKMNRLQNKLELLKSDLNGTIVPFYLESSETYIEVPEIEFVRGGNEFLLCSSKSGYNHIYHYDINGNLKKQITEGNWDVTQLFGMDEKAGVVYYQSAEETPLARNVFSIKLDGTQKKKLVSEKGTHQASFNSTFKYFIANSSDSNTPYYFNLFDNTGKKIRSLELNSVLRDTLSKYVYSPKEFFKVPIEKDYLNGWMIKPQNFDSTKKYPVLMFVYGGPGSQTVTDSWDPKNGLWYQYLTEQGYIVVSVDNRGTGARGDAFKKITYKKIGKIETEDQITAARYLGTLKFIDGSRIGIQGWSYGGYMSSLCITKGADVFKTAIAVAPVTTWRYYDSIYTERYLQTPQDNAKGYDDNSPINYADKLKGNFLIIHGTADDNVHFQNSVDFVSALIKANKKFSTFYYPNKNHSIYGGNTRLHLYTMMTDYILKNL